MCSRGATMRRWRVNGVRSVMFIVALSYRCRSRGQHCATLQHRTYRYFCLFARRSICDSMSVTFPRWYGSLRSSSAMSSRRSGLHPLALHALKFECDIPCPEQMPWIDVLSQRLHNILSVCMTKLFRSAIRGDSIDTLACVKRLIFRI